MDNIDLINLFEVSYFVMRTNIVFDSALTSLIINDYFDGQIMKSDKYYNIIFDNKVINYLGAKEDGVPISRDEILKDDSVREKYEKLINTSPKIKEFNKNKSKRLNKKI